MTMLNTTEDLLRAARENPEFRDEFRRLILTEELLAMPTQLSDLTKIVQENSKNIAELVATTKENSKNIAELVATTKENSKNIAELTATTKKLTTTTGVSSRHISDMRGLFAVQKVVREMALIVDRIGLRSGREIEPQEIIDMWNAGANKGLTAGISKADEDSFKTADLIVEAQTSDGERRYVAVEISYTADERETTRAVRNARYISSFAEVPTYAVAAGMSKDNRIDELLTTDTPEPYDSDRGTRVFWSLHRDIDRPN